MAKVSVVMPTYNSRPQIVRQSIASVMAQTYADVELIIADDGSTDAAYRAWVKAQASDRIRVIFAPHGGPSAARNAGIACASGAYILPLDDDDLIDPTYVEKAVAILDAQPEIGVAYCQARCFGRVNCRWNLPPFSVGRMLVDNVVFVSAVFRKALWTQIGGFCTEMELGLEDYDFWLSAMALGTGFYQIPEVLFHYRIRKRSRNADMACSEETTRQMYHQLHARHEELYAQHQAAYLQALREDWIRLHHMETQGGGCGRTARAVQDAVNWLCRWRDS